MKLRRFLLAILALIILVGGTGFIAQPALAAYRTWSFSVVNVVRDVSVTIRMHNFPDNVIFNVSMRALSSGGWVSLPNMDTGNGNGGQAIINIPSALAGKSQLELRLVQRKKNGRVFSQTQTFSNIPNWSGTGGPSYYPSYYPYRYWGIPTIWIQSVVRNSSVTIRTNNFPAGVYFDVFMGPMGTRGHGYYVTTFYSGSGGTFQKTFSIPPALYGSYRISIRTQNLPTGYYSYNWFYNNTAYDP